MGNKPLPLPLHTMKEINYIKYLKIPSKMFDNFCVLLYKNCIKALGKHIQVYRTCPNIDLFPVMSFLFASPPFET